MPRKKQKKDNTLEKNKIIKDIEEAKNDIIIAENFFHFASEPELVDVAIYDLEAKKSKYRYLIKEAKEKGVKKNLQAVFIENIAK